MDARVIRPVGCTGSFNTSRHNLGLCRCVVFTARYVAHKTFLESDSLKSVVASALVAVINQHPMLRVGIAGEDTNNPVYVDLESIDLQRVIEWREVEFLDDEEYNNYLIRSIESQHDKLWEDLVHRPGWKIIVHRNIGGAGLGIVDLDISFAFHHAIGDGQSALIFHRDFSRALNGAATTASPDLEGHILHFSSTAILPGPMESIIPFTLSWNYFLKVILSELWKNLAPSWFTPKLSTIPWTGERITLDPYKTNIRLFHISPKNVGTLLTGCRENGTTLTPLFHALTAASLSSRLPIAAAATFQTSTPISLRQFTNESEFDRKNTMHCLVTDHEYVFDPHLISKLRTLMNSKTESSTESESLIWQLAVDLRRSLKGKVASLPHDDQLSLVRYISDWKRFWMDKIGERREDSWSCSNPGSLKASDVGGGRWQMKRMVFTQGALPMGSAFEINVAGVENEGVWVTVSWQETVVETSLMECVVEDLRGWIDSFGENGTFF